MTDALIQISEKQQFTHNDPEAAGFTEGYWWTVTDYLGTFESGCPTYVEALEAALKVARSHGYPDDRIERP